AAFYATGSRLKKWQLATTAHIPMLAERSSLWGKVEMLRRQFEEIGMPKHKINRFGRVDDFSALESKDVASFNERCGAIIRQRSGFSSPITDLIRLAREHGAQVILVEMPMPSRHREIFYSSPRWSEMRSWLQSLSTQHGAVYVSASDWVLDDQNFEDATHLNEQGAQLFSAKLAHALSSLRSPTNQIIPATGALVIADR